MVASPVFDTEPIRSRFITQLAMLDLEPDVYCYARDAHHRFVFANAARWKMHGCGEEERMLGRTDERDCPGLRFPRSGPLHETF